VTVTRADGTVETQPAQPAKGEVWVSQERGPAGGKPVHPECEKVARAFSARRREAKRRARGPEKRP
jgi:hypothetical protein